MINRRGFFGASAGADRVEAFKSAATQAKVSGAMTTKLIAPGTDVGQ